MSHALELLHIDHIAAVGRVNAGSRGGNDVFFLQLSHGGYRTLLRLFELLDNLWTTQRRLHRQQDQPSFARLVLAFDGRLVLPWLATMDQSYSYKAPMLTNRFWKHYSCIVCEARPAPHRNAAATPSASKHSVAGALSLHPQKLLRESRPSQ